MSILDYAGQLQSFLTSDEILKMAESDTGENPSPTPPIEDEDGDE